MKILFCPLRQLAQTAAAEGNRLCAGILSSSGEPDFSRLPQIPYIFRQYEDIDVDIPGRSFSPDDAAAFADFLKSILPQTDTIICCCDVAQSRSPAIAAAVCRYLGMSDSHIWHDPYCHPNMLVFERMAEALGIPVSDVEKDTLLYENHLAFRKAIRKSRES